MSPDAPASPSAPDPASTMSDRPSTATPLLSFIIPVLNREQLVLRAIDSALADPRPDIEVIVIDDGSTDRTAAVVTAHPDPRVRLLSLARNAGQCPARNRGAEIARGDWLVFLDSDDELVPGGTDMIRARIANAPAGVTKFLFSVQGDDGAISPRPRMDDRVVDYVNHLRWLETADHTALESMPVTRREDFLRCPYPEIRYWQEGLHELNFVKDHRIQLCSDVVRLYHFDAANRRMAPNPRALLASAQGVADHAEALLDLHGTALLRNARGVWTLMMREAAMYRFLLGDRKRGVQHSIDVLRRTPANARAWAVLVAGLAGPGALLRLKTMRARAAS